MNCFRFVKNISKVRKCSTTTKGTLTFGETLACTYLLATMGAMVGGSIYGASQELKDVDIKQIDRCKVDKVMVGSVEVMATWGATVMMSPILIAGYVVAKINKMIE